MNSAGFIEVLENELIPYTQHLNPSQRLMQDNDPKHSSKKVKEWLEANKINWWKTPPESPDLNPIENLWHELKEYVRRVVQPQRKEELVKGIMDCWETVNRRKCRKYIGHLRKVISKVIECNNGGPTGY
uniref:Tc1-like transposase DDE domain-containing protein n=1 Tax=Amphimedon queenslandica TaxID=400682 RepID=A0A1X7T832_AMPQE